MSEKVDAFLNQLHTGDATTIAEILTAATESPGIFVFGEFLDHPTVQQLKDGPQSQLIELLNLFCYGSYEKYVSKLDKYPPLSAAQIRKLKQLSIIDAAHHQRHIPYKSLFEKLGISSSRDLEDLIIELFYLEAITGKLDQQRAMLEVESAIGRDIHEVQIPELQKTLDVWLNRVESVLVHMGKEIKLANERRFESEVHQRSVVEAASSLKEALRGQLTKHEVDSVRMDVDDPFVHPDLLTDGRSGHFRSTGSSVDSPGGDKDGRGRMAVFKGLRKFNK
ncbi:COP9 signalosome complex subunit 7b [Fasciola hepatica]|uniref:COP9 signalosome complex subunit 7b n=1 Tax=Fasciola hepatica TaxID=6192 RepID=A0A4E0QUB6_FASHE|nr:COP9 signalosome complex subunit 7b [Fasciola hepatica]